MAEKKKKEDVKIKTVEEDIAAGEIASLYLLCGSESYMRARSFKRLEKYVMPEDDGMNLARFDDKKADAAQIASLAQEFPAFAERRLILVRNSGFFKKGNADIEELIPRIPDTTVLIFSEDEVDKRTKLYKLAEKHGRMVEYKELSEKELQLEVVRILKAEGRTMRREGFELLLERVGTNMQDISVELEKLICYTAGRELIDVPDIDAVVSRRIDEDVFDLTNAIAEKRSRDAMHVYYELMATKTQPMEIIRTLSSQFNRLYLIKSMRSKGIDPATIAVKLKVKPGAVFINEKLAKRFSMEELKSAMSDCLMAEEAIKTGRMSDKLSAETLIIKYAS